MTVITRRKKPNGTEAETDNGRVTARRKTFQFSPLVITNFIIIAILLYLCYRLETAVSIKNIKVTDSDHKDGALSIKKNVKAANKATIDGLAPSAATYKGKEVDDDNGGARKNLHKFIVLASNHGMGSTTTINFIGEMHPCIVNVNEGFTFQETIVGDPKKRKTLFSDDGAFRGAGRVPQKFQNKLEKNKKRFKEFHINGDELYPKEATDVLDWFTQLHDNLSSMNKNSIPECNLSHLIIAMKMFPAFVGSNYEMIREFMSSRNTLVVHQTRNYTDSRASNIRRFGGNSGGGPEDEEWDTWLESSGINMIDVKAEDLFAHHSEYEVLMKKICVEAGIPVNELVSFDKLISRTEETKARQHARTHPPEKNNDSF